MSLSELWAGHIYGTNTGRAYLELRENVSGLEGVLRLADDQFGTSSFRVSGEERGELLLLNCEPIDAPEGVSLGRVTTRSRLKPDGHLSGEWSSEIGTAGTFELYPHVGAREDLIGDAPEQLYTTSRNLGVLRLDRADILFLIDGVKRKFPSAKVVVTHIDRGAELARYSEDFERDVDRLKELRWIKINAQVAATRKLQRVLTIDLGPSINQVTAQGPDEAWVLGEAEATASLLRGKQRRLSTAIGRYQVNINQVIAMTALVVMPDLQVVPRGIFVGSVVIILVGANRLQRELIPNFLANIATTNSSFMSRAWPSVLSWLISASAAVAASIIYSYLAGHLASHSTSAFGTAAITAGTAQSPPLAPAASAR